MTDTERLARISQQIHDLEQRMLAVEVNYGRIDERLNNIENRMNQIGDSVGWLVKLILGALILGVIGFVTGGGLNVL